MNLQAHFPNDACDWFYSPSQIKIDSALFFKKQAFIGGEKSQSQMTGGKKTPGKDNKAQSSSEHKGKGNGVKRHLRFALGCSAA